MDIKYIQDLKLLELIAKQYHIHGLDNRKLTEEVLLHKDERLSEDPNSSRIEDTIFEPKEGDEGYKLIQMVNTVGSKFGITTENVWGHIQRPLESTNTHHHDDSPFSWVYYVQVPEKSGDLTFWFLDNKFRYHLKPKENNLIVFPGWMLHSVGKNMSGGIRISISGNFKYI